MNNLRIITSSTLTSLSSRLARETASEALSPLEGQTVVVHSNGMARWISMELARLNGVCANMNYLYPNTFLDMIAACIIPESRLASSCSVENMTWRIMEMLPAMFERPGFEPLKRYCGNRPDDMAMLQLSERIADTFDQYTIFRPEMILEWDAGKGEGWQPELWKSVSAGLDGLHRARQLQIIRERIKNGSAPLSGLPRHISIFGISYLPPYHLEILSLLSGIIGITVYVLNPCGEYWGEIVSPKTLARISLNSGMNAEAEEYYETGNPLLSSLGTMGQEYFDLLLESGAAIENLDDDRPLPDGGSLLRHVQNDILTLGDRSKADSGMAAIAPDDTSIQVHSCHSPLREMEVLYDNLLKMFEEMPDLEPRQIVVMTPDIEACAPYITSVFGSQSGGRQLIPFTIADRSRRSENIEIETFLKILRLPSGRFGINQIMDLINSTAVMARFGLSREETDRILSWVEETNVRWGLNAEHRKKLGFPPYSENSWESGLDRLLLGYALPPRDNRLFGDILPCGSIEGRQALPLGKLADFFHQVRAISELISIKRTLPDWADTLTNVVSALMLSPASPENILKPIHDGIQRLRDISRASSFSSAIGLDAVRDYLAGILEEPGASYGFLGGKVTFCAMIPMRSIPFRVICLTGMNDGCFPRSSRLPGFNLMGGKRRRGDKSLREEDRYLFLEALMSAGERLFISYTGQSNRDNSEIPPSVVVSELVDYIKAGFRINTDQGLLPPALITRHHLQAFSEAYFLPDREKRFFSYSRSNYEALEARRVSGCQDIPFCSGNLPEADDISSYEITLGNLSAFFRNPAAFFLARRFGVRPRTVDALLEEREFFSLDPLVEYGLKEELVRHLLDGKEHESIYASARAACKLPPLKAGRLAFDEALSEARRFADRVSPYYDKNTGPQDFTAQAGGYSITAKITGISQNHLMRFRCANMKGKDMLGIWIEHLLLNLVTEKEHPRTSLLICRDASLLLPALNNAEEYLLRLIEIYRQGMLRPLPFFPESSRAYIEKGDGEAERRWLGNGKRGFFAESGDPAFRLCFGRENPLNEEFRQLAANIYGPMLAVANNLSKSQATQ